MIKKWILLALIDLGRTVVIFVVGYGVLVLGMIIGLTFARPLNGVCGNALIPIMFLGGASSLLAYRQGIYTRQFLPGLRLALASLAMVAGPVVLLMLVGGDWESAARFLGAAFCLGFVSGGIGALVGSLLWLGNGPASPALTRVFGY